MPKKQTKEEFVAKSVIKHGHKYDYSQVNYINSKTSVIIICPIHKEFEQEPRLHSSGKGCYQCGIDNKYYTTEEFILAAQKIHGNIFDYSKVEYTHSHNDIIIICKKHGEFPQQASIHLNGSGCQQCSTENIILGQENFIKKANIIHNFVFNYSKINYINSHTNIIIICPIHGEFEQRPNHHLSGHGCDKCRSSISKIETRWLDLLKIPTNYRQHIIKIKNKKFKVDAYDPTTNTIYEFYGDYWHGNPKKFKPNDFNKKANKTYGELFKATIKREKILKKLGYKIISIWQSDFYLL
jgi:hypothetical protein